MTLICPCDGAPPALANLPGLPCIAYRAGTYASFRQAVLTPLPGEQTLAVDGVPVWRTNGAADLGVMIAEWFAYIADIIAFYNERIANQAYLRTADLPESVTNLIALLGYRPRPAIGATGTLAALLSPGQSFGNQPILLPQGLQLQSKPAPGQTPQIFELQAPVALTTPDQYAVAPPPLLLDESANLLLQGAASFPPGTFLRLTALDGSIGGPWLARLQTAAGSPARLGLSWLTAAPPAGLTAASLTRPSQSSGVWTLYPDYQPIDSTGTTLQLAGLRGINPGDWLVISAVQDGAPTPALVQVRETADLLWDANASAPPSGALATTSSGGVTVAPLPLLHTALSFAPGALSAWVGVSGISIQFGFVSAGNLAAQPAGPWAPGSPATLTSLGQNFPAWPTAQPMLLQDATGLGIAVCVTSAGGPSVTVSGLPAPLPDLQPPFLLLPNLLPVSRGKTIANEILGSGDATIPGQSFQLAQAPVTYLAQGAGYASPIALTVNNLPWTERPSFHGQAPDARIFVASQDAQGNTHVQFGDGVNGARLPSGVNNVVATYRVGAGAMMPPAGKLSLIAKAFPGLQAVLNPVAVSGGADTDLPAQIKQDAPRAVLTFGRAVSVFDYAALAQEVPSVTRARAVWGWSDLHQRSLVIVYVGDTPGAVAAARAALAASGDPNRPVFVTAATPIPLRLRLTLLVTPGMDTGLIGSAAATALTDPQAGLFGAGSLAIGQTIFDSQIEAALLAIPGVVAVTRLRIARASAPSPGPLHGPGAGGFFTLAAADLLLTMEPDQNG